jgi:hypothetical protein
MRNKQKEQIKRKLILSFLLLFYLEPIKFYYLKSFQQKRSKDSFRSKLKKFKNLSNTYFLILFTVKKK